VFVTGRAGTGKSTLLRALKTALDGEVAIVAPTGLAASNAGGATIHSFAGLRARYIDVQSERGKISKRLARRLRTLFVDEVSMVRADLLHGLSIALKEARASDEPFGGVQVVYFGDMLQLPPVVTEDLKRAISVKYGRPYWFACPDVKPDEMQYIELLQVYRQTDEKFIGALNRVRDGDVDAETMRYFNARTSTEKAVDGEVLVTCRKNEADIENSSRLRQLAGSSQSYRASITGEKQFPEKVFPNDPDLVLKVGAQVLLLKNAQDKSYVNGTIGWVHELEPDSVAVRLESGRIVQVYREVWEHVEYVFDETTQRVEARAVAKYEQIPLALAYAMTIHKCQGQTLERVCVDLGRGAFAAGQLYVALSRCKAYEGLRLRRQIGENDLRVDPEALGYKDLFTRIDL